jgi:hypothetical protein
VHNLPKTDIKEATQNVYKTPFEDFITENYEDFAKGYLAADCLENAFDTLNRQNKNSYKKKSIELELIKYCGKAKQLRRNGEKKYYYMLLDHYAAKFKPNEIYNEEQDTQDETRQQDTDAF